MVSKKLVAASAAPLLLSLLESGESYGYALIQRVRLLSEGALSWNEGMLYPVLHRMERDGWIRSRWGTSGSRRRRYYALTAQGRRALERERDEWRTVSATLDTLWGGSHA